MDDLIHLNWCDLQRMGDALVDGCEAQRRLYAMAQQCAEEVASWPPYGPGVFNSQQVAEATGFSFESINGLAMVAVPEKYADNPEQVHL